MTVSVIVPFRDGGCSHRARAWAYVRARYERLHPDWQLVVGSTDGPWSKGAAIADALTRADGDVLVLADADSFINEGVLRTAVDVLDAAPWVIPHRRVFRLSQRYTDAVIDEGVPPHPGRLVRRSYLGTPGGGLVVLRRETYLDVGGIDPRFVGWGGEDLSFGRVLKALVGDAERLEGRLWHLWHPHPAPTLRGSPESEALAGRYSEAVKDPDRLREVIASASRPPQTTGGHDHRTGHN